MTSEYKQFEKELDDIELKYEREFDQLMAKYPNVKASLMDRRTFPPELTLIYEDKDYELGDTEFGPIKGVKMEREIRLSLDQFESYLRDTNVIDGGEVIDRVHIEPGELVVKVVKEGVNNEQS